MFETSQFNSIDVLAAVGLSGFSSDLAKKSPSYRVSFNGNLDIPFYKDVRFVCGSFALLSSQFVPEEGRRSVLDISMGLLTSFFSTETMREHKMSQMKNKYSAVSFGNRIEEIVP